MNKEIKGRWESVNEKSIEEYKKELSDAVGKLQKTGEKFLAQKHAPNLPKLMFARILEDINNANRHLEEMIHVNINKSVRDGGDPVN